MADHFDIDRGGFDSSLREFFGDFHTSVNISFDVSLESSSEVLEHGASSRQHNVAVQPTTSIYGAGLDGLVHDGGEGGQKIGGEDLWVEEKFWSKESLITDVDYILLLVDRLDESVLLDELGGLCIVLVELLHEIGAHVRVLLFTFFGDLLSELGRDGGLFAVELESTDKLSDVAACEWDVFDGGSDDVSLSNRDDVGNSISTINNCSCQCFF